MIVPIRVARMEENVRREDEERKIIWYELGKSLNLGPYSQEISSCDCCGLCIVSTLVRENKSQPHIFKQYRAEKSSL